MRVFHGEILLKMIALEKILEREESSFNPVVDKIIDLKYCSRTSLSHFGSHFALFFLDFPGWHARLPCLLIALWSIILADDSKILPVQTGLARLELSLIMPPPRCPCRSLTPVDE